ncbi:MAG: alpha/beta hydrolase [Bacillota bacterium]
MKTILSLQTRTNIVLFYYKIINKLFNPIHARVKIEGITCEKDIQFCNDYDICKADCYYKGDLSVKRPVFINIHGGGFVSGDKGKRKYTSEELARRGYFVYVPNYRLAVTDPFPAVIEDIIASINYLHEIKDRFNLDLDRVVLSGDSAGAYLVSMVYAMIKNESYRLEMNMPKVTVDIKCLVPFCPPVRVLDVISKPSPFGVNRTTAELFMGMTFKEYSKNKEGYKYEKLLNIDNYIDSNYNNVMLCYAEHDYFCKGHGEMFKAALEKHGCEFESFKSTRLLDNHCYHMILFAKISPICHDKVCAYIEECFARAEKAQEDKQ